MSDCSDRSEDGCGVVDREDSGRFTRKEGGSRSPAGLFLLSEELWMIGHAGKVWIGFITVFDSGGSGKTAK